MKFSIKGYKLTRKPSNSLPRSIVYSRNQRFTVKKREEREEKFALSIHCIGVLFNLNENTFKLCCMLLSFFAFPFFL